MMMPHTPSKKVTRPWSKLQLGIVFTVICSVFCVMSGLYFASVTHAATQATYYVSPSGSDSNPGTSSQPFQTLDHARSVVRGLAGSMSGDIIVNVRAGTYQLSQPLSFNAGDSGTNGYNIIYQAYQSEKPVISGGQTITGWSLHDSGKNIWQANVGTSLQTRQLYVNGARATRANYGGGIPGSVNRTSTGYTTNDTSMQSWGNASDIEFVYTGEASSGANWTESRCGVASISGNGSSTTITMQEPCWTNGSVRKCCNQTIKNPNGIENSYALLNDPGEWYLNHATGVLYYIPRNGENMSSVSVVAPVLETLVTGSGSVGSPVHNIQFKGLTFSYATWLRPSTGDGFINSQADSIYVGAVSGSVSTTSAPANIAFHTAHNIRFERNVFEHLGAEGLVFDNGSQDNTVIGNVFTDISASGVRIGDVTTQNPSDSRLQDTGNQVTDNYLYDMPVEYHGGIGIWIGYVANNTVSHNELGNMPYSGISEGWGWGDPASYSNNNRIQNNYIHDIMEVLVDGGGIYLNGQTSQPGSVVSGNYILNQPHDFGALYPDEGSSNWEIHHNVVENAPRWLHIWTSSIHDINVHDNFSNTGNITNNGTNITLSNNYTGGTPWPQAAQDIINNAGIEAAYQDIKNGRSSGGSGVGNVALNKSASASSQWSSDYSASKAVDGDISGGSGWSAAAGDNSPWWEVDLGNAYRLSKVEFVTRQGYDQPDTRQNFEIWASNNGDMSLGHVVLGSQGSTPLPAQATLTLNITDTTAYRYLAAVKTGGGYFFIAELRAFSISNLAVNKSASASSEWDSSYSAGKAVDGDTGSGWSPKSPTQDNYPWLEVDLGSAHTLTQIQIVTRQDLDQPDTRQNFEVWASNNADMSLGHVVLGSQGSTSLPYQATWSTNVTDTTAYRYIAVVKSGGGGYLFISELRVLGA